jgi:hypothetical protein
MVGGAGDPAACGGDDFDEAAAGDLAGRGDRLPLWSAGGVVVAEDKRFTGCAVDVTDSNIPRWCDNGGISAQAVDGAA